VRFPLGNALSKQLGQLHDVLAFVSTHGGRLTDIIIHAIDGPKRNINMTNALVRSVFSSFRDCFAERAGPLIIRFMIIDTKHNSGKNSRKYGDNLPKHTGSGLNPGWLSGIIIHSRFNRKWNKFVKNNLKKRDKALKTLYLRNFLFYYYPVP
jgi:hypothetical protein